MGLDLYMHNVNSLFEDEKVINVESDRNKVKRRKIKKYLEFLWERYSDRCDFKLVTVTFKSFGSWLEFMRRGGLRYCLYLFRKKNRCVKAYVWVMEWHKNLKHPHYHIVFMVQKGKKIRFWDEIFGEYGHSNLRVVRNLEVMLYLIKYISKENKSKKRELYKLNYYRDIDEYIEIRKKIRKMRVYGYSYFLDGSRVVLDLCQYAGYIRRSLGVKYKTVIKTFADEVICKDLCLMDVKIGEKEKKEIFEIFWEELEGKIEKYTIVGEGFKH